MLMVKISLRGWKPRLLIILRASFNAIKSHLLGLLGLVLSMENRVQNT